MHPFACGSFPAIGTGFDVCIPRRIVSLRSSARISRSSSRRLSPAVFSSNVPRAAAAWSGLPSVRKSVRRNTIHGCTLLMRRALASTCWTEFGKRCAASDTFTDKCIRQKKTPRRASSWRESLAGVPFPCISRVSPVHTSGVWLTRNLPPQRISILTFIIRQCLYGCKALFYSVNIYSISSR